MTYLLIAITVILWASAYVGIRAGLADYEPFELALFRYVVASAIMGIFALIFRIRVPSKEDLFQILLAGLIGIAIYNVALNYGELTITAGEACFIINTSPLFTVLFAYTFLNEAITHKFVIGMILSFIGVSLMVMRFDGQMFLRPGSLMVLIAAVSHAAYFVIQRPLLRKYRPIEVTSYAIWGGTVLMLPFGIGFFERVNTASFHSTVSVIYLGVFPAAIAYLSWSFVLSKTTASRASSYLYSVPVVTLAIGFVWLREIPSDLSIAGGAITIGGVAFANLKLPAYKALIHKSIFKRSPLNAHDKRSH